MPPVGFKRQGTNEEGSPLGMFGGIFIRKERWGLAWRGWLVLVIAVAVGGTLLILAVYPFLAVTHRVNSNILVVEGWVHEYAIRAAIEEFRGGFYERAFTTGGPVEGTGGYINDYQTSASVGADLLKKNGLPNESLQMVPSRVMDRDRTYGSAVALRNWFRDHDMRVNSINIVTENTHARRTRLLFEEALGNHVAVGIIAVRNPDYDPKHWWRYSAGLKDVVSESFAYVYAKFFFHPSQSQARTEWPGRYKEERQVREWRDDRRVVHNGLNFPRKNSGQDVRSASRSGDLCSESWPFALFAGKCFSYRGIYCRVIE